MEDVVVTGRRAFLTGSGQLAGAGWVAFNLPLLLAAGQAAADRQAMVGAWINLTADEAASCAGLVDQIIPPDDMPGASEIGVVYFIDQALGGFMAGEAAALKAGLADLDRRAREAHDAGGFAELAFEKQTGLLRSIETTPFFKQMIFLTHCGMFAIPSWGGNRDLGGWALLGFDSRHAWQPPFGFYDAQAERGGHGHA